jgi:hypothetical protein
MYADVMTCNDVNCVNSCCVDHICELESLCNNLVDISVLLSSYLTASQFSDKFKSNFITSSDNQNLKSAFLNKLNNLKDVSVDFHVSVELLEKCLLQLNNSTCLDGLCKSHIAYAHEVLRVILAKIYNSFITHYFVPSSFSQVIFFASY